MLGFETSVRNDLYRHMQALPMEFHSRWQSGQLLSRITMDLSSIRRFMGFGLLFLFINIIQLTLVTLLLLKLFWPLGLVVALSAVPIILLSKRFESRYVVVSRRVQDQQGDVATAVEEAAVGYRVIKSFGRRRYSQTNFHGKHADALRDLDGEGPPVGALLDLPRGHSQHLASPSCCCWARSGSATAS